MLSQVEYPWSEDKMYNWSLAGLGLLADARHQDPPALPKFDWSKTKLLPSASASARQPNSRFTSTSHHSSAKQTFFHTKHNKQPTEIISSTFLFV